MGPHCAQVAEEIIRGRPHPEQGYRACLGLLRLSKAYEAVRVEAACQRAVVMETCSYQSIRSILKSGKDREALPTEEPELAGCARQHENVRGRRYYEQAGGELNGWLGSSSRGRDRHQSSERLERRTMTANRGPECADRVTL